MGLEGKTFAELRQIALDMEIQPARSREKMLKRIQFFLAHPTAGKPAAA